jgi:hypothetical protein
MGKRGNLYSSKEAAQEKAQQLNADPKVKSLGHQFIVAKDQAHDDRWQVKKKGKRR